MFEMKAIMISIQPKWCELIASGKKIIEVRKTKPNLDTPFKVYIYCTKGNIDSSFYCGCDGIKNGKVIGEFVCDSIISVGYNKNGYGLDDAAINGVIAKSCINEKELYKYLKGEIPYLWHISDLVIYDQPKELREFKRPCINDNYCARCKYWRYDSLECDRYIKYSPQDWRYV